MRPFEATAGEYVAVLSADERDALARHAAEVALLVRGGSPARKPPPWVPSGWAPRIVLPDRSDPAVRRLLPDVSSDESVAREFRRLAAPEIVQHKVAGLDLLIELLAESSTDLTVTQAQAQGVATAFTDIRLMVAERLAVRTDEDVQRLYRQLFTRSPREHAEDIALRRHRIAVFLMAGQLQESLVEAMLSDLPTPGGR